MSVAPRWKRRADEIAEAIGDELSVNGTVSIGNDVSLSVATITALADAIALVLNPSSIAAAIWLQQEVASHVATVLAANSSGLVEFRIDTLNGVFVIQRSHIYNYDISAQVYAGDYATGTVVNVTLTSGTTNQYRLLNPSALDHNVSVLSTIQQPVHVELKNVTGGFSALGVGVSNAMKLSPQPISIASTVNVKTDTGESVAISGTVNLNVGSSTVPISNPNNITVPVRATSTGIPMNSQNVNVTCPVSVGTATVPVKATVAGIPQNANGISLYLPVDANHGLTMPVGNGGMTSIPVGTAGLTSIPVTNPNSIVVLVENTNSVVVPVRTVTGTTNAADGTGAAVVVPVDTSGTAINVKIVEISDVAPSGGVAPTEALEAAMEDAINDAEELTGVIVGPNIHTTASVSYSPVWDILGSNGVTYTSQYLAADSPQTNNPGSRHVLEPRSAEELRKYLGRRVRFNTNATAQYNSPTANGKEWFLLTDGVDVNGTVATDSSVAYISNTANISGNKFKAIYADGTSIPGDPRIGVYDAANGIWLAHSYNHLGKKIVINPILGVNLWQLVND